MTFLNELKIAKHYYDPRRMGPIMVDIHPTLACQNRCNFCISDNPHVSGVERKNYSRKHQLDWPVLKNALVDMKNIGVKSIQLTGGGEPTLYPQFDELMDEVSRFNTGLITNGILLGELSDSIIGNVEWLRVSLDASNAKMYMQIKKNEAFNKVISGLTTALDQYRKTPTRTKRVGVAYVLTAENIEGIVEVAELMQDIRPDYLQFKDVVNRGMMLTDFYHNKIDKAIAEAREVTSVPILYSKHNGIDFNQDPTTDCRATDYVAALGADGKVYGCCHLEYLPQASYGSIYEKSFSDIWNSRPKITIREELCWNCRFGNINQIINKLDKVEDGDFL
jgi:MoaA/NifB/PqqE/SkfB family radical SAM enzyme